MASELLSFVEVLDKLKKIERKTLLHDESRYENTAEHSWHLSMAVWALVDLSNVPIDLFRAIKMALAHDIVEIEAGDTFVYDERANLEKVEREKKAAAKLFSMAGNFSAEEMHDLWKSYELRQCAESKFVNALDRFLPLYANYLTKGHSWKKHGISKQQVLERNSTVKEGSQVLWEFVVRIVDESVSRGWLAK